MKELTVTTPSTEHAYLLMRTAELLLCTIQRYYWQSKFDSSFVCYIEPKIADAYDVVVTLRGDEEILDGVREVYNHRKEKLDNLPKTVHLSDKDIRELSFKMLAIL